MDAVWGKLATTIWAATGGNASLNLIRSQITRGAKVKATGALIAAAKGERLGEVKLPLESGKAFLEELEQ